jgi:hypothetical protein
MKRKKGEMIHEKYIEKHEIKIFFVFETSTTTTTTF